MRSTPWSPDHDAYLLLHQYDNREDLSRYLGRTKAAIGERLRLLRGSRATTRRKHYDTTKPAWEPTPEEIKAEMRAIREAKGEAADD